jgi:hypothetical protein
MPDIALHNHIAIGKSAMRLKHGFVPGRRAVQREKVWYDQTAGTGNHWRGERDELVDL